MSAPTPLSRMIDARELPAADAAERSVLGAVLLDNALWTDAETLDLGDFLSDRNRAVFAAMRALRHAGAPLDPLTVGEHLRRAGDFELGGGGAYVAGLMDSIPRLENIAHYIASVREAAARRRLIRGYVGLIAEIYEGEASAADCAAKGERIARDVADQATPAGLVPIDVAVYDYLDRVERARTEGPRGVPTGIPRLEKMTGGWQRTDLILLAARPSVGKTALGLNVAAYAARHGFRVAFFSLEMSQAQLAGRLVADRASVNGNKARFGAIDDDEHRALCRAGSEYLGQPLAIDDTPALTVEEIRARAWQMKRREGLDLVVVDYLQLIGSRGRAENRNQEVSKISRGLKLTAKELDVPMLVLSQLSRAPEQRADHRPQLSDLRDSGALEQDADLVLFLHPPTAKDRPELWEYVPEGLRPTELLLEKQRNGPTGCIDLVLHEQFTRFVERGEGY
jgi:replicative DNA helicase